MIDTTALVTTPTYHHPFSPSSIDRIKACPGSWFMQQGMPREESDEADEGTMLHDRVATGDLSGLTAEQEELIHACEDRLEEIGWGEAEIIHEKPLEIYGSDGDVLTSGTADVVVLHRDASGKVETVDIIDWKFGRTPVKEVSRNFQLAAYALGAMQLYGVSECNAHIIQPRIHAESEYCFTKPANIQYNIEQMIKRAKADTIVLEAGEHCKYCRAKSKCPAFARVFEAVDVPNEDALTNPETLLELWNKSKVVEKYIDKIKEAVEAYVTEHGELGGWHWKEKPGNREIKDVSALMNRVGDIITPDEFYGACKVSVAAIVGLLVDKLTAETKAQGIKATKAETKRQVESQLSDLITRGKATRTLVAE